MAIIEQRVYVLKPVYGPADYFACYDETVRKLQIDHLGELLGYFISEVGELNAVISLWRYPSFEARLERRAALAKDSSWKGFLNEVRPMLQRMENRLLLPAAFSPIN